MLQALRAAAFDASTAIDPFSPDYDALARAADPTPSTVLWTHEIVPVSDPSATLARRGRGLARPGRHRIACVLPLRAVRCRRGRRRERHDRVGRPVVYNEKNNYDMRDVAALNASSARVERRVEFAAG